MPAEENWARVSKAHLVLGVVSSDRRSAPDRLAVWLGPNAKAEAPLKSNQEGARPTSRQIPA